MTPKPMFLMNVEHFCAAFSHHTFLSIFCNLFVSRIAFPVKTEIKKPCQQQIHVRCPWKYESSRWKCLLLVIGRFRIRHTAFRWFSKMYFRFLCHHVDISSRDVTELYTAINSDRSLWQRFKSAWPYRLQFCIYRGKNGLGAFTHHLPG